MTQPKTNKKALLTSALSLLLCCTMLIGTTWAWFTDSVTSSGNKIQSGTLQIDLLVKGGNTGKTKYTSVKDGELANKPIFNYELWEPGYTLVTYAKVINKGNLALKYTLNFTSESNIAAAELAEVIDVYYAPSEVSGIDTRAGFNAAVENGDIKKLDTLQNVFAGGEALAVNDNLDPNGKGNFEDYATIVLKMQETAGNEYQDQTIPAFDICLLATQWTYEKDTFNDQYDVNATYPILVSSLADLNNAITAVNNGTAAPGSVIDGNGATVGTLNSTAFRNDVTVQNVTFDGGNGLRSCYAYADVVFENCTFKGNTYGAHFDGGNGSVTFKDCEFYGWNSYAGTLSKVTFENCTFHKSTGGYACVRFYQEGQMTNCTFDDDFQWIDSNKDGITVKIDNATGLTNDKLFLNDSTFTDVHFIVNGVEVTGVGVH